MSPFAASFDAAELDQRVDWDAVGSAAVAHEVSKSAYKELRAVGHKLVRFLSARKRWWRQAAKGLPADAPEWARGQSSLPPAPDESTAEGFFVCTFVLDTAGFQMLHLRVAEDTARRLGELWQRSDPEAPKSLSRAIALPSEAEAPLWLALLRLKPLRDFWDREMRRATVDTLLSVLPDSWVLDPEAVPKGAVIPRLEISSWSELPDYQRSGRALVIANAHSWEDARLLDGALSKAEWEVATQEALEAYRQEPRVLVDASERLPATQAVIAIFYEIKGDRVEGLGGMALVPGTEGRLLPARLSVG